MAAGVQANPFPVASLLGARPSLGSGNMRWNQHCFLLERDWPDPAQYCSLCEPMARQPEPWHANATARLGFKKKSVIIIHVYRVQRDIWILRHSE